MPSPPLRIAVIGAGAAGLVAARELRREGHAPVVFERTAAVGGTWLYSPAPDSADPLGAASMHSSLYASLRTNLPREPMGFLDFPFVARAGSVDPRRFPGHEEVLRYLQEFARRFDLLALVQFETEVVRVRREADGRWTVRWRKVGEKVEEAEVYDAVVVCNGHNAEPRVAVIPGIDAWPGKQMHSHIYRVPQPFLDQVDHAHKDGVVFQDGSSIKADIIMHCTGYNYSFPFLGDDSTITVDDNRVYPLYKHVFPPEVAPQLSFIGLPFKCIPFPLFELQGKWVAGVLSGRIKLPSEEEMMEDMKAFYSILEDRGWPKRYTHNMAGHQFEYDDWLAEQLGHPKIEEWRKEMFKALLEKLGSPESYRDGWRDDHLLAQANEDFQKYF